MGSALRFDALLFASMCVCGSVIAWVGVPYIPAASQPRNRRVARIGSLVAALILVIWAFMPSPRYLSPLDVEREQVLVVLTPLWCLFALVGLAAMVIALRYSRLH